MDSTTPTDPAKVAALAYRRLEEQRDHLLASLAAIANFATPDGPGTANAMREHARAAIR